jgi:CubicO group peptidase (beta-lactamase class C family)
MSCDGSEDPGTPSAIEAEIPPASSTVNSPIPTTRIVDDVAPATGPGPATSSPTAGTKTPLPPQPAGVPFPTEAWPQASVPATGVGVGAIITEALADDRPFGKIDAILLVQGGAIVAEAYDDGWGPDRVHSSWSIAKSVTHAMVGVLARDGRLDVDAPAAVAEWAQPGDDRAAITPRMLMQMTSGLQWDESSDVFALVADAATVNVASVQAGRPLVTAPGSAFSYSTGSTAVVGRLIGDLVGTDGEFRRWASTVLFEPLGIDTVELTFDADGYWVAGYGADMTARDFARLGLLYLRDGVWDGTQILPENWVEDARTPTPLAPPYGSGFWIDVNAPDTFSAEGFMGQKIVIVPDADLVVVVLAQNADDDLSTDLATALINAIRPN